MQIDPIEEARRQAQICNACRYCEGYCSVFPALHAHRTFADGDLTQLANLCHNCRGCYYACQYTAPHEFDLNLPKALAEVRQHSWTEHAWPQSFAKLYDRSGLTLAFVLTVSLAFLFWMSQALQPTSGEGFYAHMSHTLMVAIFAPAFVFPILGVMISLKSYWRAVSGEPLRARHIRIALTSAAQLANLRGGGDGCNFEDVDRFSHVRRYFHQATMWGFLMCFASTASGTVLHYGFGLEAPYGIFSLPKLFGVPGGLLLCAGSIGLAWLKVKADRNLGAPAVWGGEMAFVLLLFAVSATGLLLYFSTGTQWVGLLLPIHLATVLTLFLLLPFSKMVHGFFRLAALARDAQRQTPQ